MDFGARLSRLDSRRFEPSRLLVRGCRHEVREEAEEEKDVGREAGERREKGSRYERGNWWGSTVNVEER